MALADFSGRAALDFSDSAEPFNAESPGRNIVPPYASELAPGMAERSNVELWNRPVLNNSDGTYSTTFSASDELEPGVEVVYPQVVNGKKLTRDAAIQRYYQTGEHLGKFDHPDPEVRQAQANQYASALHNAQDAYVKATRPDFSSRAKPVSKGSFLFPGVTELTQALANTPNELPDPNKPEESFLGALPKQLRTAADTTAQTGLGLAQRMLESPPSPNIPLSENDMSQPPDFALRAREAVTKDNPLQNLSQALDKDIKANTANVKPFSASGITGQILSSAPPMIAAAAATAITKSPLLGASMVGASVFGQEYSQERAQGISPEWADLGAAVNGFSESLGEEIPLGMLMRPGSKFLTGTLKVAGAEGLQEFLTQIVQTGYDKGVLDPTMTWGQAWASVLQAGIVGGIMGGGLNIAAHPFRGKELTPEQQKILNTSSSELLRQAKAAKDLRSKPNAPIPSSDYVQIEETPEEKEIKGLTQGIDKDTLEGAKVYHPESDTENSLQRRKSLDEEYHHAGITDKDGPELAAAKLSKFRDNYRLIEKLHAKAKEIGLQTNNSWDIPELTAEIADHEAHLTEKQDIINPDVVSGTMEDYERGIDEYLHKNFPEYLDDLISRTGAAPESLKTPGHEVSHQNGNAPTGGTLGLEEPNQGAGLGRQGTQKSLPPAKAAPGRKGLGQQVLGLFNRPLEENTPEPLHEDDAQSLPIIGQDKPAAFQRSTESQKNVGLTADLERMVKLFGSKMYGQNLPDVTVKELLQNSFDALKAAYNRGDIPDGSGKIEIAVNLDDRTITISDNGAGMSPEIVEKAFLTLAGTDKSDLSESERSGGLGLAKLAFIFGNEGLKVRTVRDGVETTLDTNSKELMAGKAKLVTRRIENLFDRPKSGTTVEVTLPESVKDENGETKEIYLGSYASSYNILTKPLIGDVEVRFQAGPNSGYGPFKKFNPFVNEVLPLGQNEKLDDMPLVTAAHFPWGDIDLFLGRIGPNQSKYNARQYALSSGIYQFDAPVMTTPMSWDNIPYNIYFNVKPKVGAAAEYYPFNNQREGWSPKVKNDIAQLMGFIQKRYIKEQARDLGGNLAESKLMPMTKDAERAADDHTANNFQAIDFKPYMPSEYAGDNFQIEPDITIKNGETYIGNTKTDMVPKKDEFSLDDFRFPSHAVPMYLPYFHSNLNIDIIDEAVKRLKDYDVTHADVRHFFSALGTVVFDFSTALSELPGYQVWSEAGHPVGISLDKTYYGVHVRVPFHGFFLNPLATKWDTNGANARNYTHTLLHEGTHTRAQNHTEQFTTELGKLESDFEEKHPDLRMEFERRIVKILQSNKTIFNKLREIFNDPSTENVVKDQPGVKGKAVSEYGRTQGLPGSAPGPRGSERLAEGVRRGGQDNGIPLAEGSNVQRPDESLNRQPNWQRVAKGLEKNTPEPLHEETPTLPLIGKETPSAQREPLSEKGPVFYSALQRGISEVKLNKAPAKDWLGLINNLKNKGVKEEELEWSGIREWLRSIDGSVTKEQVEYFLKANEINIKEVQKGESSVDLEALAQEKYGKSFEALDEEENYQISLLAEQRYSNAKYESHVLPGGENYRELLLTLPSKSPALKNTDFRSGHWDEPNVIAHVRFNDRTDADGKKTLFIEEIQSDWHQKGRREGYADPNADKKFQAAEKVVASMRPEVDAMVRRHGNFGFDSSGQGRGALASEPLSSWDFNTHEDFELAKRWKAAMAEARSLAKEPARIPNAPFKTAWPELAFKRILRHAAENGYASVSWTTGDQQAARYDLSKHVREIHVTRSAYSILSIDAVDTRGHNVNLAPIVFDDKLADVVGKDLADKILKDFNDPRGPSPRGTKKVYSGLDLKVGGEGMKGFYDKILPAFANRYAKKWGAKVGEAKIALGQRLSSTEAAREHFIKTGRVGISVTVHSLPITESMRESVLQGQPLFQRTEGDAFRTNPGAIAQEHADEVRSTETKALQDAANRKPNWQRVAKGLEGILPEERQANEIRAKVEKTLRKIVPKSRLVIAGNLRDQAGEVFGAAFERQTAQGTRSLIALSVRSGNAVRTALHEAIHALKRNGFFSPAEWTALKEGAENGGWLEQYKIQSTYPDLTHDGQIEEAVAERFSDWMSNRGLWLPKSIRPIFIKLAKLVMLIRGHVKEVFGGKLTADEVMARIDSGSVGNRPSPHVVSPENTQMARRKAPTPKGLPLPPTPPVVKTLRDKIREAQIRAFGEGIEKLHDGARSLFTKVMPTSVVDFMRPFTEGMGTLHRAFLLGTVPMSVGTPESRAIAKDFITNLRETNYQYRLLDDHIVKHYARDSRKAMWDQAEEENAFALKGKTPGPAEGINKLTADEKALVLQIKKLGDKVFATAQALGMVKGPGVPFWTPRMIVEMTRGLGGGVEVRRAGKAPQKYTSDIGRNLSTTAGSLKERKYQFAHETEAAAKLKFGSNVEIVPDIRTSVLALQKIEHAIAGREFVNRIRDYGLTIGASLVSTSKPNSEDWFTLEHPAFYERELEFIKDPTSGKMIPKTDQFGNLIFHGNQLWIHKDFEGPMKAVLNKKSEVWYNGIMSLKGKQMSLIMFSPIMHNAVIWGKAIPADPLNVGLFQIYGKGATVIADKAEMSRAIKSGVDPVGRRYFNQDITAIAEQQEGKLLKPGRSITANLVAAIPGLFDKAAGVKVKEFIDKWGDIWHNKYLWDQVFKLQMGIWKSISDSQVKQGMTQSSADRIGAHFANRYAGSLPMESMSKLARQLANLVFFSRSFTFSNLGSWKDLIQGLPRDLQGQILRDEGKLQLSRVQGVARRKAAAMLAIDIGLSWAGLSLAAMAIASIRKMIFGDDDGIVWPSENEPGKEFRVFIGYDEDGTALYARFAWGKVGEEMLDWVTEPREEVLKKQSPQARVAYAIASNDTGFGMQMYDPNYKPEGPVDYLWQWAKYAGKAIGMVITGSGPALFVENLYGLLTDTAHMGSHALATILPPLGITVSHGAPGGPAVGEMYAGRQSQEFKIRESLAGWRDRIRNGDDQAVRTEMREAGMDPYTIQAIIRTTKNPKLRLTPRAQRQFNLYATPEQRQRLDNARARQP